MTQPLIDFAVITIFAREVLEGSIIIGEYRTIILRGNCLKPGVRREDALRAINISALFAAVLALVVIAAVAIPLAILSKNFDPSTAKIIEGVSKIVAGISLLQLSLKLPKWLGVYGSRKNKNKKNEVVSVDVQEADLGEAEESELEDCSLRSLRHSAWRCCKKVTEEDEGSGLSLRSIRFNVAWNIWREVAECGVFLIPFFLSGEGIVAIPLSGLIGFAVGLLLGLGIYYANKRLKNKVGLAIFAVLLLVILSAGLFTGGCHNLEMVLGSTKQVWKLSGDFWSVDRLPMTILKPFGYNDTRTVLEIVCFWSWLALSGLLHYRKYRISPKISAGERNGALPTRSEERTVETGDSSLEGTVERQGSSSLESDGTTEAQIGIEISSLEAGEIAIHEGHPKERLEV